MSRGSPGLRDLLAGQYVLGTLRGPARRRFRRLLLTDADLRQRTTAWEEHLGVWTRRLAPVAPREEVWERLAAAIAPAPVPVVQATPRPLPPPPAPPPPEPQPWASLALWRPLAGAALAACLALGIALAVLLQPTPEPSHAAMVIDGQGRPVWLLEAWLPGGRVKARAFPAAVPPPGRVYELWMIPGTGSPVSLGLLPAAGETELELPAALADRLQTAAGLAVSIEPAGGSPTGQPTGPVPYQAALTRI